VSPEIFYDPQKGKADKYYCMKGGDVRYFEPDLSGFSISADYLEKLDDVYKWSLYVARESLQDSGYLGNAGVLARCGVILGNLSFPTKLSNHLFIPVYHQVVEDYLKKLLQDDDFKLAPFSEQMDISGDNARISGYPAAVIAQAFSLSDVYFSLDAACASSLYSVKLACDYLESRQADLMMAGAVSAADPFFVNMGFSIFQALPQEGSDSCPLDKNSAGLTAGEGAGMFVLKRYSDAARDGDRIYAVIQGIGLSNDGKGQSVLSPNPEGQYLAFEKAYKDSGTDPGDIEYLECHATGTTLGDKVELNSMDTFFGEYRSSLLAGSVKSNLGHLLTAAGMASMIKVILSMAEGVIPATINLKEPQNSANQVITGENIPISAVKWPGQGGSRSAAVSAFGFGGTNAHLIFKREEDKTTSEASNDKNTVSGENSGNRNKLSPMAIVGMDAHFGSCHDLRAFNQSIYDGKQEFIPLPPLRWKGFEKHKQLLEEFGFNQGSPPEGAYIDSFDLDFLKFRIPPNEDDRLIPQQLLAIKVADNALKDAQIKEGQNVAVIVAMETELALHQFRGRVNLTSQFIDVSTGGSRPFTSEQKTDLEDNSKRSIHNVAQANQYTSFIGNIMAARISSLWNFTGPAFTVSAEESSVFKALSVARIMLDKGEVDAVLVGAVDLSGGLESVLWRNQKDSINSGSQTMSFDQHVNGWMIGEGAGAVVLKKLDKVKQDNGRIYAAVDSIGFAREISDHSVAMACQQAFTEADVNPADIDYIEVCGSGAAQMDEAEVKGLINAYQKPEQDLECAIGSVKANIGHTFAASGIAGLIKTALCVYNSYIPGIPGWSAPMMPEKWSQSPFYMPGDSRTWFLNENKPKKVAAVNSLGQDGTCAHLILSREKTFQKYDNQALAETSVQLFLLPGDGIAELLQELDSLQQAVKEDTSLLNVANLRYARFKERSDAMHTLALIGRNQKELLSEIKAAKSGIEQAFASEKDWASPRGSYFTVRPSGDKGKTAFVYPGGFTSYIGLGRDMFQLFPDLYEKANSHTSRLSQMTGERLLYPRSISKLSEQELKAHFKNMINTPIAMFESGIMFAIIFTDIVRDYFRIEPQLTLGYSMGEISMFYALGVWDKTDKMSDTLHTSSVFRSRLAGPMDTVRDAWNLPPAKNESEVIWHSYSLKAPVSTVKETVASESRVYSIIINTPEEVVIAGEDEACQRVIRKLDCDYFPVPMSDVIHCELVKADYDELAGLHRLAVNNVAEVDFYSAVNYTPVKISEEGIADNIATLYCNQIDFPRLVKQAYNDGARIFLELGPRDSCSKWIKDVLGDNEHLAVGINRKGVDDKSGIVQALAKLASHKVSMDLSPLYLQPEIEKAPAKQLIKTITLGGASIEDVILSEENKKKFAGEPAQPAPTVIREPVSHSFPPPEVMANFPETVTTSGLEITPPESQRFDRNLSLGSSAHSAFLESRRQGLWGMGEMIRLGMKMAAGEELDLVDLPKTQDVETSPVIVPEAELPSITPVRSPDAIWDEADLQEFADGNIASVFGEEYAIIDSYHRRVRLPLDPYLLVSRVTKLDAERGEFKPSSMTTEYDIPHNAWYSIDGQIPWAVTVESGQCDLLLISYLGIDFECKGERVYRLLDCTLTFLDDLPKEGETLIYDIKINSFARSGDNLLFFFSYECFVKDKMILKMDGGCAGFFSDKELEGGRGIILTEGELEEKSKIQKQHFEPFLNCDKTAFDKKDLLQIIKGNIAACFGVRYGQKGRNPSLRFAAEEMLMFDRVISIDPREGAWGLGEIIAEKVLAPDHWYFPCHFKDDQVMAGSLMAEGCGQLLQFYQLFLGLQVRTKDARFQPISGLPQRVRCRGQVIPTDTLLTYRMEVKEIGLVPVPYAIADVDIILGDRVVVDFKDLGVQLSEKHTEEALPEIKPDPEPLVKEKEALFTKYHFEEFATGSIAKCFGPEFDIYENRQPPRTPNGDLQLVSRVLEVTGKRHDFKNPSSVLSEYDVPPDAWFFSQNSHPSVMPYSVLMEISLQPCGFISAYAGTTLIYPETDYYFRNLDGDGNLLRKIDLRGKTITNRSELFSTVATGNAILQQFRFELSHEEEPFYQGTAVFGYFIKEALTHQLGLDRGVNNHPLHEKEYLSGDGKIIKINLKSPAARQKFYDSAEVKPYYYLGGEQFDFLDEISIVEEGGKHGQGYIYAAKKIDPGDWFYPCHFYQDPVMPGSLGVESILQSMKIFAMQQDMGVQFRSPYFDHLLSNTIWKYRGQITPGDDQMALEVHIKKIDQNSAGITIAGDASLWKNTIRIYEVKDAAICLAESQE